MSSSSALRVGVRGRRAVTWFIQAKRKYVSANRSHPQARSREYRWSAGKSPSICSDRGDFHDRCGGKNIFSSPRITIRAVFPQIEARGLVKMYGTTCALAGVDADFHASQVTAICGPNGSGKSTLLSLLALLSRPSDGTLRFGKFDARKSQRAIRESLGVVAHEPMLYPDLTGEENLALYGKLYGVTITDAVRERFGIGAFAKRPVRTYSRGQRQRVSLARALLHAPSVLLLDEPATGLDASSIDRLAGVIEEERNRGAIVVVITHDEAFAERVSDARINLARGRRE